MNREESARILNDHGRQALARVIYTELRAEQRDAGLFYAMYGDTFPESERIKRGDAFERFDPCNFEAFYRQGDPWFKAALDLDDSGTVEGLIDAHMNSRAPIFDIESLWAVFNIRETRERLSNAPEGTREFEMFSWLCNLSDAAQVALFVFIQRRWPNAGSEDAFERESSATIHALFHPTKD
jgi:hypothetical protein